MLAALPSCVIAGPPDYQDPGQTPPVLDLTKASFSVFSVLTATTGVSGTPATQFTFTVPVRSQDVGDDGLIALLYLDYGGSDAVRQPPLWTAGASTFDDTSRIVRLPWSAANQTKGCHTLTMMVTHASNVDFQTGEPVVSIDPPDDVAYATWWVDIDDDSTGQDPNPMSGCPKP